MYKWIQKAWKYVTAEINGIIAPKMQVVSKKCNKLFYKCYYRLVDRIKEANREIPVLSALCRYLEQIANQAKIKLVISSKEDKGISE